MKKHLWSSFISGIIPAEYNSTNKENIMLEWRYKLWFFLYCFISGLAATLIDANHQLDPLGHHAVTCKGGGDVVMHRTPQCLEGVFSPILS